MDELAKARWKKQTDPNAHPPRTALERVIDAIETNEIEPVHIIVVVARKNDDPGGVDQTTYYQAGSLDGYAQVGLLSAAIKLMQD